MGFWFWFSLLSGWITLHIPRGLFVASGRQCLDFFFPPHNHFTRSTPARTSGTVDSNKREASTGGIPYDLHEHDAVLTVEAQVDALGDVSARVTKNLFLKDKRNRLFVVTALPETKVDLKVLSARLGNGKSGVRMAPDDLLGSILQVSLGSVSPIAVCQPTASSVVLLLDQKLKDIDLFCVHPIVNTASIALSAEGLEIFLRLQGREVVYVDFENPPPIDKEHPPDLKAVADGAQPLEGNEAATGSNPESSQKPKAGKKGSEGQKKSEEKGSDVEADALDLTNALVEKLAALTGKLQPDKLQMLRSDIQMELSAFQNAAYTRGYLAARDQIAALCQPRHQ